MRKIITWSRYSVLGVFIICNVIICSVAIWNFSIGKSTGVNLHVDVFLAVVGALALLFVFPIGFAEILCMDPVTCHLWFECLWVGFFASLEFSGAVALSAIAPSSMCNTIIVTLLGGSCSSTQVLMAFSWTCSICLIAYFFLLISTTVAYARRDPRIWHYKVRRFPETSLPRLRSTFIEKKPNIVAPKPRRAVPAALYSYRSGLSSQYDIEHFRPPTPVQEPPNPPASEATPWHHMMQNTPVDDPTYPAMSFYPQYMQSILTTPSLTRPQTSEFSPSLPSPALVDQLRTATLPLHAKRKSTHFRTGLPHPPKPTGPRARSNWRRLEPVDLPGQSV